MKTGWQVKSLGEVASITAGQSAPQGEENFSDKGFPFIRAGSLEKLLSGCSSDQLIKIEEDKAKKHGLKLFSEGCVLFAKSGMSSMKDRVIVLKSSAYVVSHIAVIKPDEGLDSKYLAHWLSSFRPSRLIKDESYPSISLEAISNVEIPLPPLPIQKQIAEILEKADQAKQKRKEANRLTEQFLQSAFIEMFGDPVKNPKQWEITNLGSVISTLSDYHSNGSYESLRNNVQLLDTPDYTYVVRTTDLEKGDFENNVKYFSQSAYEYLAKSKIYGGEIIINKIGSAGKVYLMPNLNRKVSLGMNQFALRINNKADNIFIYYLLKSNYGEAIISKKIQGAVTKTITKDAVRSLDIPLPPLSLQQQFAELVQEVEVLKEKQKQTEIELDNLFNSLMQKAFRGELV